jgi:hypothetical protein
MSKQVGLIPQKDSNHNMEEFVKMNNPFMRVFKKTGAASYPVELMAQNFFPWRIKKHTGGMRACFTVLVESF